MAHELPAPIRVQQNFWILWFLVYALMGAMTVMGHDTALFWDAADRVDSAVVRVLFLNVPLQFVLALGALVLGRAASEPRRKAAMGLGAWATTLIVAHVMISLLSRG